eukprot:scaffold13309_cov41-Attheya_sp.AAC.1
MDILQEQHVYNTPIDAALRRNARHMKEVGMSKPQQKALREFLLYVARRQGRLDWRLRQAKLECTPEHRVVLALALQGAAAKRKRQTTNGQDDNNIDNDDDDNDDNPNDRALFDRYPWVDHVLFDSVHSDTLEVEGMDLQTRLECPNWAWPGLCQAFPTETELSNQLLALQQKAPLDLRVNTLHSTNNNNNANNHNANDAQRRDVVLEQIRKAGFPGAMPTPWSPLGIRLLGRVPLGKIPGLLEGRVEPQDEGSQLVTALVDAQPGELVADYCAGTGGKTLPLAAQMKNRGRLYALDVEPERLERGRPRCNKAGVANVQRQAVQSDMTKRDKWCKRRHKTFDRVLVDAPCSGVGSWRRKPDARRTWGGGGGGGGSGDDENNNNQGVERLEHLLPLQQQILQRASRLVKPGGRLVYVTCSLLPQENNLQIAEFLKGEAGIGWRVDPPHDFWVPFNAGDDHQFLRLTPLEHGTDGFFAAVLTRDPLPS